MVFVIIGCGIPDIDSGFSSWGRHWIFKPLQFFFKHRTFIHSLTFGLVLTILIAMFFPIASFGFFVGFASHILLDSFTKDGIQPFWPFTYKSRGFIVSGGRLEGSFFISLLALDFIAGIFYLLW
jgi:inner membrane protein